MNLKSVSSAISIVPVGARDLDIHRPGIAHQSAIQNATVGVATNNTHVRKPYTSLDDAASNRRNALVLEHLRLVKIIAASIRASLPVHVDIDDLMQAGTSGLMDAANKFEPTKGIAFTAYAKFRIKGAILDSLRSLDEVSRDMRRVYKQVESVTSSLAQVLQRAPDEGEIAEKLGMNVESLRLRMLHMRSATRISTTSRADEDLPPPEFSTGMETFPDAICARKELQNTVRVAMKKLPQRDQKILLAYYGGELKMWEIGGMLGINESRVSQLSKRALKSMELQLRARGITSSQPL
jgi:RNA polymerase sigma factor FliA